MAERIFIFSSDRQQWAGPSCSISVIFYKDHWTSLVPGHVLKDKLAALQAKFRPVNQKLRRRGGTSHTWQVCHAFSSHQATSALICDSHESFHISVNSVLKLFSVRSTSEGFVDRRSRFKCSLPDDRMRFQLSREVTLNWCIQICFSTKFPSFVIFLPAQYWISVQRN